METTVANCHQVKMQIDKRYNKTKRNKKSNTLHNENETFHERAIYILNTQITKVNKLIMPGKQNLRLCTFLSAINYLTCSAMFYGLLNHCILFSLYVSPTIGLIILYLLK